MSTWEWWGFSMAKMKSGAKQGNKASSAQKGERKLAWHLPGWVWRFRGWESTFSNQVGRRI